jgi:hypothetical protein
MSFRPVIIFTRNRLSEILQNISPKGTLVSPGASTNKFLHRNRVWTERNSNFHVQMSCRPSADKWVTHLSTSFVIRIRVDLGYNVMKGTNILYRHDRVLFPTEECNFMANIEKLIGTIEYLWAGIAQSV